MNQATIDHYMRIIRTNNPNGKRFKSAVKKIETIISDYRVTFIKMRGTVVAATCNGLANSLQRQLDSALDSNHR